MNLNGKPSLATMQGADSETAPLQVTQFDRRDFLKLLGGGLLVCLTPIPALTQESGRSFGGHELPKDIRAVKASAYRDRVRRISPSLG